MNHRYVCCLPEAWLEALEALARQAQDGEPETPPAPVYSRAGDTLTLYVQGILLPTRYGQMRCTPCDELLAALDDNADATRIILRVDSPGGVAQGVDLVHARLMRARETASVEAVVEGLCASAAYWLTSAAQRIACRPTSEVGGIGVYRVYYDRTEALRELGVRPVVVRSGPHKAIGVDGVSDEQQVVELENVRDIAAEFVRAVAAGRGMDQADVAVLATGRTYVARRAVAVGLADAIDETSTVEADDMMDDVLTGAAADAACVDEVVEDAAPAQADVDAAAVDEASAVDPVAEERRRVEALLQAFSDDPVFTARCVREGLSLVEAKAVWFDEKRASAAIAAPAVEPVAPVCAGPVDHRERVRQIAAQRGISIARAWAAYWREIGAIEKGD